MGNFFCSSLSVEKMLTDQHDSCTAQFSAFVAGLWPEFPAKISFCQSSSLYNECVCALEDTYTCSPILHWEVIKLVHFLCINFLWFLVWQKFDLRSNGISNQAFLMQDVVQSMILSRLNVKNHSLLFSKKLELFFSLILWVMMHTCMPKN